MKQIEDVHRAMEVERAANRQWRKEREAAAREAATVEKTKLERRAAELRATATYVDESAARRETLRRAKKVLPLRLKPRTSEPSSR